MGTIATTVFVQSLSNFTCKLWMMRGEILSILGHGVKGQGQLLLCVQDLVGRIQTTVFTQSISNFTCKVWMMRGGSHWFWVTGSKVNFGSVYKTLWAGYRLQFSLNHFQTSNGSWGWWEEELYWFWITGSKVKVNFGTPCVRPCGHNTDYSFYQIIFKLHM